jgi:hypothetical protein
VLTIIQQQKQCFGSKGIHQRFSDVAPGLFGHIQGGGDSLQDKSRIRDGRKFGKPHPIWVTLDHVGRRLECQSGFACSTGAGERDERGGAEQPFDLTDLPFASDKTGQLDGQVVRSGIQRFEGREVSGEVWVHDLEEMLGVPQVFEAMTAKVPEAHSRRKVRGGERLHGMRDENLASVPSGAYAGGTVHIQTNIVTGAA